MQESKGIKNIFKSDNFGIFVALRAVIFVFTAFNRNYFTSANLVNVLTAASLTGLIAVGESLLLIAGYMDLSAGSLAAFAGVSAAMMMRAGMPVGAAIPIVILLGVMIGCVNAFFITQLKIDAFIVTMALQCIVRGFAYIISNGEGILITNSFFLKLGTYKFFGLKVVSFPILLMIVVFLVFYVILAKTQAGREIYFLGGNPAAARLAGISLKKTTYKLYIIMGVLASVGGMVLSARMNTGQPQACVNLEFDAITAAVLGGIAMSGGYGTLSGTCLGLLLLQCFNNGLILINVPSFWQSVAKGVLLLLALSFDYFRSRKRG